jgi:hypothetical protein
MSGFARVTIKGPVNPRQVTTKNGPKTIYSQEGSLETQDLRMKIDVEVDGPNHGYREGEVLDWDLFSDIVPGTYGPQLARRMTLRVKAAAAKAA